MADMAQTESESQGAEGQLNTQSEKDPLSIVTFVYRGENPYMRFLARGIQSKGVPVEIREIPSDVYKATEDVLEQHPYFKLWESGELKKLSEEEIKKLWNDWKQLPRIEGLVESTAGPSQGVIVTDRTIGKIHLPDSMEGRQLIGYDALDWYNNFTEQTVVEKLTPLIEQVRVRGKQPVLLPTNIGDHIQINQIDDEHRQQLRLIVEQIIDDSEDSKFYLDHFDDERYMPELLYMAMIKKNFDIPIVIPGSFSFFEETSIQTVLKAMGLDPEKAVLLVDHHLYNFGKEQVQKTGMGEIPIVRICPCCVANVGERGEHAEEQLQERCFKLFPIHVDPNTEAVDKLMEMIEKKRAQLLAQKLSSTPPG